MLGALLERQLLVDLDKLTAIHGDLLIGELLQVGAVRGVGALDGHHAFVTEKESPSRQVGLQSRQNAGQNTDYAATGQADVEDGRITCCLQDQIDTVQQRLLELFDRVRGFNLRHHSAGTVHTVHGRGERSIGVWNEAGKSLGGRVAID